MAIETVILQAQCFIALVLHGDGCCVMPAAVPRPTDVSVVDCGLQGIEYDGCMNIP